MAWLGWSRPHQDAVGLRAFGTPTLLEGGARAYLKLAEQPPPDGRAMSSTPCLPC